jgi:ubiquinone biosynthesis protein
MQQQGSTTQIRGPLKHALAVVTSLQLKSRLARIPGGPGGGEQTQAWLVGRLRLLGPTYIKMGQFIASRGDVYNEGLAECFRSSCNRIKSVSGEEARSLLEMGVDLKRFRWIDTDGANAASIAQVHRGELLDGRRVVVKVMRPGVREDIASDMAMLIGIVKAADRIAQAMRLPPEIMLATKQALRTASDLQRFLAEETDFENEVRNITAFGRMYPPGHATVYVPRVIPEMSSKDAIVMEDVPSSSLFAYEGKAKLAQTLMGVFVHQLIGEGIMHGDPHAGNMGVNADGRLVLYDFGSVIRMDPEDICHLKDFGIALVTGNASLAIAVLRRMGAEILDEDAVKGYIADYREYMRTLNVKALMDATSQRRVTAGVPIVMPTRISRIMRSFTLIEGVCKALDPDFNYSMAILPVLQTFGAPSDRAGGRAAPTFFDTSYILYRIQHDLDSVFKV